MNPDLWQHLEAQTVREAEQPVEQDKTYSFCDALSFVVMERLGITEAIAFDRHFREYGRVTIL